MTKCWSGSATSTRSSCSPMPMAHFRGIRLVPRALRPSGRLLRRGRADEPRVRRHGHGLQLLPAPTSSTTSSSPIRRRAGSSGCASSAHGAPRRFFGAPTPSSSPPAGSKSCTAMAFFYGYGDKFQRDWMAAVGEPSRAPRRARVRARRPGLPGRHGPRLADRRRAVRRLRTRRSPRRGLNLNLYHPALAREVSSPRPRRAVRAGRRGGCRSSRTPTRGSSAGSSPAGCSSSATRTRPCVRTGSC